MSSVRSWARRSANLTLALAWRTRREGLKYLFAAFIPLVVVLSLVSAAPVIAGSGNINGAASAAALGARYGASSDSVGLGLLLMLAPGMIAIFSAIASARMIRGLIGADVSRGGLEALLAAPYSPGNIGASLQALGLIAAVILWLVNSALAVLIIALSVIVGGGHLTPHGGYLAVALALPLLASWVGSELSVLTGLLLPRLTQLGTTIGVAGGDVGTAAALIPGIAVLLTISLGILSMPPVLLITIVGGATGFIGVACTVTVAYGFRPAAAIES